MKYLLDEHLSAVSARICRDRFGLDAVSVDELGRKRHTDEEQLEFAAAEDRVIVTRDQDFVELTALFMAEGRAHAGVLFVPRSIGQNDHAGLATAIACYERDHPDGLHPYAADWLVRGA